LVPEIATWWAYCNRLPGQDTCVNIYHQSVHKSQAPGPIPSCPIFRYVRGKQSDACLIHIRVIFFRKGGGGITCQFLCYKTTKNKTSKNRTSNFKTSNCKTPNCKTSKVTKGRITKRRKLQKVAKQKVESDNAEKGRKFPWFFFF
jgi:hypothetical protein